jgi:hypothetical protein
MSPWEPATSSYNNGGGDGARPAAKRVFDYIYKGTGPFGGQSRSTVEQQLTLFEDGKLLMEGVQKMPELPCECY